jgi:hypothetical protein
VKGLVALWREALLAQAVLLGRTKGYKHHPQLSRFQGCASPAGAVAAYLKAVHAEAAARGYNFDGTKIGRSAHRGTLAVTRGQMRYEWEWLGKKVEKRDPVWGENLKTVKAPEPHPLFRVTDGDIETWEKVPSR